MSGDDNQTVNQPDEIVPSVKRQGEIEAAHRKNVAEGKPPYQDVEFRTRGELLWVMRLRGWSRGLFSHQDKATANLSGAVLENVDLSGVDLQDANLSRTWLAGADLSGANLTRVNLSHADLRTANLTRADLWAANLSHAVLTEANLSDAILLTADLSHTFLDRADLSGAHLSAATLSGAHMENAMLSGTNLTSAHLEGADLSGAHLEGRRFVEYDAKDHADLQRIRQWNATFPSVLPPADLRLAFLDRASQLAGTVLGDADLGYVRMADTRWGEANLAVIAWSANAMLGDEHIAREEKPPKLDAQGKHRSRQEHREARRQQRAERLSLYHSATRANRQLATVLRAQGLNDEADYFAYRAQLLQREVLRRQGKLGQWFFSWLLWALAGYGYRLQRILITYALTLTIFALVYYLVRLPNDHATTLLQHIADAYQVSLTAIHGRTFFEQFGIGSTLAWVAAAESVCGLVIEAVFTSMLVQRFFVR